MIVCGSCSDPMLHNIAGVVYTRNMIKWYLIKPFRIGINILIIARFGCLTIFTLKIGIEGGKPQTVNHLNLLQDLPHHLTAKKVLYNIIYTRHNRAIIGFTTSSKPQAGSNHPNFASHFLHCTLCTTVDGVPLVQGKSYESQR